MRYSLFIALFVISISQLFSSNCEPERLFKKINCPSEVCSKKDFENWEKKEWDRCREEYYYGSVQTNNIEESNSIEAAKKRLIENRASNIITTTKRKTTEKVSGNDGTFSDDYQNEVSSSSSALLTTPRILHKDLGDGSYITHAYKYIEHFKAEIKDHDNKLYEEAQRSYDEYKKSLENGDFNKAYDRLSFSYLCISNRFSQHELFTDIEQDLKKFLNQIEINFNPKSIKNIPVYVDNNKAMSVTAKYDDKNLSDFEFEAFSETGIGNWPNNKKIEMTNSDGRFEMKIGNIITTTEKQSIILTPKIWRFDDGSKQTFWEDNFSVAKEIKDNSIKNLEAIVKMHMESFDLYINVDPMLSISFKNDGGYTSKNKIQQQEIFDQIEKKIPVLLKEYSDENFRYGECLDDECVNILINYSLLSAADDPNKKIKLEMNLDDDGFLSKFSDLEITLDKNFSLRDRYKRDIKESMKDLHKKLFFSEITYDLADGVELILDKLEKPLKDKGKVSIPKGKVNFKFEYNHSFNKKMMIYETDYIISNSFEINDKFKEQSTWNPEKHPVSYKFYKDWRWEKKSIRWDPISSFSPKDKWEDPQKNFKSCPNYICTGKSTKSHKLIITENGYKPIYEKIDLLDAYAPEQMINLEEAERLDGTILNYIIPGFGFYSIPSPNPLAIEPITYGFYQNDRVHSLRGILYTFLTVFSINQALIENSKFKEASKEFEDARDAYLELDPETSQSVYDNYYSTMQRAQTNQQRYQNNFSASVGVIGFLYGINFIEVAIIFGGGE